jgi:hypothetical protein
LCIVRVYQGINGLTGVLAGFVGKVGVSGGCQDADMAKDFLQLKIRSTPASSKWVAKLWRNEWHEIFFYAELLDNGLHGGLDSPSVKWQVNQVCIFEPSFPTRKDEMGMPVQLPEIFQDL